MKKLYKKKSQIKCIHCENIRANRIVTVIVFLYMLEGIPYLKKKYYIARHFNIKHN